MSKDMFSKWDKYWTGGNSLLAMAYVLDPRSKMVVVKYYYNMISPGDTRRFMSAMKKCFNALFKEYLDAHYKAQQNQSMPSSSARTRRNVDVGASATPSVSDTRAGLKDLLARLKSTEPILSDLEQYLADPLDPTSLFEEFDILAWWKVNAPKYPILARLARDVLTVPISTVASESTFSIGGRVLSAVRASLNNESIEALICAQDWLRSSIKDPGEGSCDSLWAGIDEGNRTVCGSGA